MRVATFVTCIGQKGLWIYSSLPFCNEKKKQTMSRVLALFEEHCIGESNVIYDHYMFNNRHQEAHKLFDKYLTDLRELVGHCHFGLMSEELLRDHIVCGVKNPSLREQLLEKKGLTLCSCVDMCRANEVTAKQHGCDRSGSHHCFAPR